MNIVIAGAGQVGTHLARMLVKDNHDITVIDDDIERIDKIRNELDLMAICGSAHSFKDLKNAMQSHVDLFVAVTTAEERNVLSCSMASYLGAHKTIARINNSEYMEAGYRSKLLNMGIDELVYPEELASQDIVSSLKLTAARQRVEFADGNLVMLAVKIRSNAPIVNLTFEQIAYKTKGVFAVAIKRAKETIIPGGKDYIRHGDVVYFVTKAEDQAQVLALAGKDIFEVKSVLFLGGSRIAQKAIEKIEGQFRIKVIDSNRKRCEYLADRFSDILVINGDGRDIELLKEENLESFDAFVATTGSSEANILSCHLAKAHQVKRTIAQVEYAEFSTIAEDMNIGTLINKKQIAASFIYKFTLDANISKIRFIPGSDAEVIEFRVREHARITYGALKELNFPSNAKVGGIIRDSHSFIADGNTVFLPGDRVVVFTMPDCIKKLEKFF